MGGKLCEEHQKGTAKVPERPDMRLTRKMRQDLGLGFDLKSSEEGCRSKENVTERKTRNVTAGMMYMLRPCGITLASMEMINAGE